MSAHLNEFGEAPTAELWDAWRLAEREAGVALDAWYRASTGGKDRTYADYMTALEVEALAADVLAFEVATQLGGDRALAAS